MGRGKTSEPGHHVFIPPFMFWLPLIYVYISLYRYIKTLREIKRATSVIHNPIALTQVYPHAYTLFNYTSHTPMRVLPELEEARSIHCILVYWSTPFPDQPPLLP